MLQLYYYPGSCSLAPHIALEEAGARFEAIRVNLAQGEQRKTEFLSLNPKGRVPLLMTEHGGLTENPAILMYIAMTYPKTNLVPVGDPFQLARVQSLVAYLASTVHVAHAHGPRGSRWADEPASLADMKRKVPETMAAAFAYIESECIKGPWVMGDQYTIADPYLYTFATWLEADRVDPRQFPKVFAHRSRMGERPAVKRVLARESSPA